MPQPQVNLPNKEGLRRISSLPPRTSKKDLLSDQPPRSNSDINPNELRPPTTPSPANEGPSHVPSSEGSSHVPSNEGPSYVPSSESEKGKESSFWSRLSSIWAWLKKVSGFGHKSSAKVSEISSLPNVSGEARNVEETATDESKQNSWTLSGIWNAIAHKRFYATPVTHPSWPSSVRDELTTTLGLKGPWEQWGTMVFNPRPPTDVNLDREISSVRGFGKELLQNKQEALKVWKEKIKANGKSDFEAEILSTDLFLELARQLSTHQDRADKFQKSIIRIAKEATEVMGSKEALKAELKRIVEVFDTAEKQVAMRQAHPMFENPNKKVYSVIGTNWDHDYYQRPLSPLLLLYEKPNISTNLASYAKEYHDAVEHFQRTNIVIAAVKHYIEEVKKVTPIHESYGAEVLEYFRNMEKVKAKDDKYLEKMGATELSREEQQAIWDGTFDTTQRLHQDNPPRQSHQDER
ncbi:hypothetical protein PCASD_24211 [Puccinia coronata f. sp. avenae]|uniref:Uncharacterized protein n=1 Tax=Puccinia coronata f. sp. avenae TaxID=200324 RepID=A0A2N5S5R2_9BASI|nr:hypothetical protein PCASD_24211 [Puccinia coronata f. sp. avenae]